MITPADSPSSPSDFAGIAVQPMNIQAGNDTAAVQAALTAANDDAGAGVLYPRSERQRQTETLITSPPGFATGGYDIDAGTTCGWPNNVEPGD